MSLLSLEVSDCTAVLRVLSYHLDIKPDTSHDTYISIVRIACFVTYARQEIMHACMHACMLAYSISIAF